jgi:hypothetical protein
VAREAAGADQGGEGRTRAAEPPIAASPPLTLAAGPRELKRCWECNTARLHIGWRQCREVLGHTAPDAKAWLALRREGHTNATAAAAAVAAASETAAVGLRPQARCWECSEGRFASACNGWRWCREVLGHTAPDARPFFSSLRDGGADAAEAAAVAAASAYATAAAGRGSPGHGTADSELRRVQAQPATPRHEPVSSRLSKPRHESPAHTSESLFLRASQSEGPTKHFRMYIKLPTHRPSIGANLFEVLW